MQPKLSKTQKSITKHEKASAGQYLQNIHFPPSSTLTTVGRRKQRKTREIDAIENEYDSKRAELYSAARSQAISTVNQIERRLQSQLATVHKLGLQQYGGRSSQG